MRWIAIRALKGCDGRLSVTMLIVEIHFMANNRMHSDIKKRRSFLAMLFDAGDARRSLLLKI